MINFSLGYSPPGKISLLFSPCSVGTPAPFADETHRETNQRQFGSTIGFLSNNNALVTFTGISAGAHEVVGFILTALLRITVQAKALCTRSRAKKIVVGLTIVSLTAEAINFPCLYIAEISIVDGVYVTVVRVFVPATVLIVNVVLVRQVSRRVTNGAENNLGIQHHQSTSYINTTTTSTNTTISLLRPVVYHHRQSTVMNNASLYFGIVIINII